MSRDVMEDTVRKLNEKCLELDERVVYLESTIYQFRLTLEPGKIKGADVKDFCEAVDDYFNTMEAGKNGGKIGLA